MVSPSEKQLKPGHQVRSATQGNWTIETWVGGTIGDLGTPIAINIRLCPAEKARTEKPPRLKLYVTLTPAAGGAPVKDFGDEPELHRHKPEDDTPWHAGDLPPEQRNRCWQWAGNDIFKSDWFKPGTTALPRGHFNLTIETTINGDTPIQFDPIPMRFCLRSEMLR
jgi:hypothetical protein